MRPQLRDINVLMGRRDVTLLTWKSLLFVPPIYNMSISLEACSLMSIFLSMFKHCDCLYSIPKFNNEWNLFFEFAIWAFFICFAFCFISNFTFSHPRGKGRLQASDTWHSVIPLPYLTWDYYKLQARCQGSNKTNMPLHFCVSWFGLICIMWRLISWILQIEVRENILCKL